MREKKLYLFWVDAGERTPQECEWVWICVEEFRKNSYRMMQLQLFARVKEFQIPTITGSTIPICSLLLIARSITIGIGRQDNKNSYTIPTIIPKRIPAEFFGIWQLHVFLNLINWLFLVHIHTCTHTHDGLQLLVPLWGLQLLVPLWGSPFKEEDLLLLTLPLGSSNTALHYCGP
jgi:hypothetical protein